MGKHKNAKKPRRPSDKLPPDELQEKWNKYLDAHVGKVGTRPRFEVLIDAARIDDILYDYIIELENRNVRTTRTECSEVYVEAFRRVVNKLPILQRLPVKYYFGIDVPDPLTQQEIAAKLGIDQTSVFSRIEIGLRNLKRLIKKELGNVAKERLRRDESV